MTATAVRERPILFSGPMVRAILAGQKTQTRRVVSPKQIASLSTNWACPYGEPGGRLWVRETWADLRGLGFDHQFAYLADGLTKWGVEDGDSKRCRLDFGVRWKPSIHMPRKACRLFLAITKVRVTRLQDISEDDAKAEGVSQHDLIEFADLVKDGGFLNFQGRFRRLWDSINAKRGHGWDTNPWVWAISFQRFPSVRSSEER